MKAQFINQGDAPLRLAGIKLGGANVEDFVYTHTCGRELAPNAGCEIAVRYRPLAPRTSDAYLTLDAPAAQGTLRLPLLARAADPNPVAPVLREPRDGALFQCFGDVDVPVDFSFDTGRSAEASASTRQKLRLRCPEKVKWRVEATAANQRRAVSEWRTLNTVRSSTGGGSGGSGTSGTAPGGPPQPPGPRAS